MQHAHTRPGPRSYQCRNLHVSVLFALILASGAAAAATARDVALSGQLFGGRVDGDDVWSLYGTGTMRLFSESYLHVEAFGERFADLDSMGLGGHLFWRITDRGLVGLTASYAQDDAAAEDDALTDFETRSWGVEAELYVGAVVLAFQGGWFDSDLEETDDQTYTAFDINWYPSDAWYLRAGVRTVEDATLDFVEGQYTPRAGQSPLTFYGGVTWNSFESQWLGLQYWLTWSERSGWSAFIEFDRGENGFDAVYLGLTYEFGPVDKAPTIALFSTLAGGI